MEEEKGSASSGTPANTAQNSAVQAADTAHAAMDDCWREFNELYRDVAVSFGLSESAWNILYAVYLAGDAGISQHDICEQMCLGKQTVNSSTHKLSRDGIVEVERVGRASRVRLTGVGRELAARVVEPVVAAEKAALCDLGPKDRARMYVLVRKFSDALRGRFSEIPGVRTGAPRKEKEE